VLKRQKNRLLEVITEAGLDPHQFIGGRDETAPVESFVIRLKDSPLAFSAYPNEHDYDTYNICHTLLAPGFPESALMPDNGFVMPFGQVATEFRKWLDKVVRGYQEEQLLPDLWAELGGSPSVRDIYTRDDWEGAFSEEEKLGIRKALSSFRAMLAEEFSPSRVQLEAIGRRLGHLESALDRLDKFDWLGVAISTLMTIAVALSLDTAKGQRLFELFRGALASAIRLLN
jgi:hypothetical protein